MEDILTLSKLVCDSYGHGIINLKYSKKEQDYLHGFDYSKSYKSKAKIRSSDEDYIIMFVCDYIENHGDIKLTDDLVKKLKKNMNDKFSEKVLENYLLKTINIVEEAK